MQGICEVYATWWMKCKKFQHVSYIELPTPILLMPALQLDHQNVSLCICLTFCVQGNMNLDKILYSHKFVSKKGLTLIILVLSFLFLLAISELNYTPVNCCCTNYRAFQS